jgi:tetratricopeptide (TPR) repeat protein
MHKVLMGLALALAALPALAQTSPEEWQRCQGVGIGASIPAEARIGYCTQLIQSGRLSTENIPRTYLNRGRAYYYNHQYDQAVADITHTIALKPSVDAYINRAGAYEKKGMRDQAISDYRAALGLNPNYDYAKQALTRLGVRP